MSTCPREEAEGFRRGGVAGAEDAVDELGGECELESRKGAFRVDVVTDYVGDVVYGCKVIVFGGFQGVCGDGGDGYGFEGGDEV